MARYRVRSGHVGFDLEGKSRTWGPGDIVETNQDLGRHNTPGMTPKFELLEDKPQAGLKELPHQPPPAPAPTQHTTPQANPNTAKVAFSPASDKLDSLGVKELQALAAEEEIDLKGATKKEDIVRILRSVK